MERVPPPGGCILNSTMSSSGDGAETRLSASKLQTLSIEDSFEELCRWLAISLAVIESLRKPCLCAKRVVVFSEWASFLC